ncbi:phage tail protein [Lentzea sp. PSKA42]|uniref:Phage tail protein n=1 Tax=Lentzea indica TaxID=2604800 RepID=A0ABX1F961_9PSEU|nr:phage tail protein [Lentzea indica]NKE55439.1 phage tail protein [Lentzea indica]
MSLNPTLVRVPGTGELSLAPPGTPEPTDPAAPLLAPWSGLGLSTEDGVTIRRAVERSGTTHWQQITPARYIYTSQELTVASVFQETRGIVLGAYFGGMTFTETAQGSKKYRAEISSAPKGDERALCVDWVDQVSATQVFNHRLYIPRVEVSETAESQWTRTQEARWGLTFAALSPASGTTLAVWLTNDPAVLLAAPSGASLTAATDSKEKTA